MLRVLVSDPVSNSGNAVLKDAGLYIVYEPEADKTALLKIVPNVDGWIIRSGTTIDQDLIEAAGKLQVIGRAGVGVDNIDISAATQKGIVVMNTPDVNTVSAAEHTIGIMLALARNISIGHVGVNIGEWNRHSLLGTEL